MSLLFYNYALRARNIRTIYLGQSVPSESLMRVVEIVKPDFLLGVITNPFPKNDMEKLLSLSDNFKSVKKIFLSGKAVLNYKKNLPSKITIFKDVAELIVLIRK
jgi:hypothetical protein